MAVVKIQENVKKSDGTYDVVHKETEASLVNFSDNETLQQKYNSGELNGQDGKSAYQQAVEGGYSGTEAQFKAMLASGPWLPTAGGMVNYIGIASHGGFAVDPTYDDGPQLVVADVGEENSVSPVIGTLMVKTPTLEYHAANKKYVDDKVSGVSGGSSAVTYGTCSTSYGTAAKVVTAPGFELKTGAEIWVKFTHQNTAISPTLDVNNTGAKYIKKYGTTTPNIYMWTSGAVVGFIYDGTYWIMVNGTTATTSYYGVTKLSSSVSSGSTTEAATPSAVKTAYDRAKSALQTSGGDMAGNIDMNNHFVTGLPAAYAPSDAVSLSTVIKLMVSSYSTATAIVRGVYGSENRTAYIPVTFSVSGNDGSDMLLHINSTITISSCNLRTITDVTLQFPPIYKEPGGDWSYVPNALQIKYGSSFVSLSRINTGIPYSVVFEGFAVASDITISGDARVGVVQL